MSKGRHTRRVTPGRRDRMRAAVPHGPHEPCTCTGCSFCTGGILGCTCDIDWTAAAEIRMEEQ